MCCLPLGALVRSVDEGFVNGVNASAGEQAGAASSGVTCPHCGSNSVGGHGSFLRKDGGPARRFRCRTCRRTFSENTGTPAVYLKHQTKWRKMTQQMNETRSLRGTSALLGVHLSTAFRWRHRWLADRCSQAHQPLSGSVSAALASVPYSEKGSLRCNGPGSWGYWNKYRRGSLPRMTVPPGFVRSRFRPFVDGHAISVLLVWNDTTHTSRVLGQRPGVDKIQNGMRELVSSSAHVYDFEFARKGESSPIFRVCEQLNLPCQSGCQDAQNGWQGAEGETCIGRLEYPALWLSTFRRVATKYLHHYMAWFDFQMMFRMRLLRGAKCLATSLSKGQ